jgi:hypothetical protein
MVLKEEGEVTTASEMRIVQRYWAFSRLHLVPWIRHEAVRYLWRNWASTKSSKSV